MSIISAITLLCKVPLISCRSARTPFGKWSKQGCYVFSSNERHTECHCDHMTNYAVLMRTTEQVLCVSSLNYCLNKKRTRLSLN